MSTGDRALTVDFDGHPVTAVRWKNRWAWRAAEAGTAIGYEQGRYLVDKIRGEWAKDFREGVDFDLLRGAELAQFQALLDSGDSSESRIAQRGARSLLILYPSGIDRALILSRTEKGQRLRDMLVDYVLPQLRETGTATLPGAPPPPAALPDPGTELRLRALERSLDKATAIIERLAGSARLGGVIGATLAREAIEAPAEAVIEVASLVPRARQSVRRWLRNKLTHHVGLVGPWSEWENLPIADLAKAQRVLFGLLREVPERARAAEQRLGITPPPGPLFAPKPRRKKARL